VQKGETSYLHNTLQLTYKHTILQVGCLYTENQYIKEDFRRNWILVTTCDSDPPAHYSRTWACADELPIACDSVDVLILPHLLEFQNQPYLALAEAERVLKPGGELHIFGLNPWSIDRIFRRLPPSVCGAHSGLISCPRLLHWLGLLRFDAEFRAGLGGNMNDRLPDTSFTRAMAHLATAYAIRAIKRTHTLIPIKAAWVSAPTLTPEHVAETPMLRKIL